MRSARLEDGTVASAFVTVGEAEARARSAARIAAVVEDSPDLVWMFDGRGLIEYASPSVSTALGLRQDELIGRLWRAITHPDDVPMLRAALADAGPDEPRTPLLELRLRASDGTWRWVEGQATLRFRGGRRDRGRGHRARRHPHARRRGARAAAVVAARGAGRRRAGRDRDGRRARPDRGHQRAGAVAARARAALDEMIGWSTELLVESLRAMLADADAEIARLREIVRGGEPVRFHFLECRDGRRMACDYVPLDGRAAVAVPRHHAVQADGGGAARRSWPR